MTTPPFDRAKLFSEWLQQHGAIPSKVARSFAFNPEDQRDLRQQMHLQLWRSIEDFSGHAKPSTWIYRVCLNTAMTWRRTERRRRLFFEKVHPLDLLPNESRTSENPRVAALYNAIHQLRPADRALILLHLEERSYREMAEITGLSETHVGVRLQRARRELARRLQGGTTHD